MDWSQDTKARGLHRTGEDPEREERLETARQLVLSIEQVADGDPVAIDPVWLAEIESRLEDITTGRVELVDADETYRLLTSELAAKQE